MTVTGPKLALRNRRACCKVLGPPRAGGLQAISLPAAAAAHGPGCRQVRQVRQRHLTRARFNKLMNLAVGAASDGALRLNPVPKRLHYLAAGPGPGPASAAGPSAVQLTNLNLWAPESDPAS